VHGYCCDVSQALRIGSCCTIGRSEVLCPSHLLAWTIGARLRALNNVKHHLSCSRETLQEKSDRFETQLALYFVCFAMISGNAASRSIDRTRVCLQRCFAWLESHPNQRLHILALPLLAAFFIILFRRFSRTRARATSGQRSPDAEKSPSPQLSKNPAREPGVWIPSTFKRPAAPAYPDWDVRTTKPLPYRPFRWGLYHITMGLRSMHWDEWIELDNRWPDYHRLKCDRIVERGVRCCKTAPEAFKGACELLEELCDDHDCAENAKADRW